MDHNESSSVSPRKVRFAPKSPPRRKPKTTAPQPVVAEEEDEAKRAQYLLRRVNEKLRRQGPKVEKTSSVQVVFGPGAATPSDTIRTFGVPRDGNSDKSSGMELKVSTPDHEEIAVSSASTTKPDETNGYFADATDDSAQIRKRYKEPWDYVHSYYPTTLPLRKPHSGDPEILDEAEFGEASTNLEYDEKTINPASELGLLEESEKARMFLFQLPANLPLVKQSASAKGKEIVGNSTSLEGIYASAKGKQVARSSLSSKSIGTSEHSCRLEDLAGGHMGKMLVYKSGAIKLKLGEILYDVSPGLDCTCVQDVVAINTVDKHCYALGELGKRVIVTPDVDSLLDSMIALD